MVYPDYIFMHIAGADQNHFGSSITSMSVDVGTDINVHKVTFISIVIAEGSQYNYAVGELSHMNRPFVCKVLIN